MALWHLMFQKPAFSKKTVTELVDYFKAAQDFGGFKVEQINLSQDTGELLYVDLKFHQTNGLTLPAFAAMAKYLLIVTAHLQEAPPALYFGIMQQDLTQLGITYYQYPDHSLDLIYWQAPPNLHLPHPGVVYR